MLPEYAKENDYWAKVLLSVCKVSFLFVFYIYFIEIIIIIINNNNNNNK